MTATNHALTGALIGLTITSPLIAIPVALLSHLLCDLIPHFGMGDEPVKTKGFRYYLLAEALLCFTVVVVLIASGVSGWPLAALCAFIATTPDFLSINKFRTLQARKHYKAGGVKQFLTDIQWFERPSGAIVEIVWCAGAITLLTQIL